MDDIIIELDYDAEEYLTEIHLNEKVCKLEDLLQIGDPSGLIQWAHDLSDAQRRDILYAIRFARREERYVYTMLDVG